MNGAFYIGATSLDAQQRALEVVANNIANINTVGFKRSAVQFSELVAPVRDADGNPVAAADNANNLAGVMVGGTPHVWTQGDLKQTGQQLDLAINGDGFLELMGPGGQSLLWRGGTMKVNEDGYLAAGDGTPLRAMISVPQGASSLTIGADGVVSALVNGQTQSQQIGQLELVMAKDPNSLIDTGNGYYQASDAGETYSAKPGLDGGGTLVQGSLETSNVQLTDEMTNLLLVQRAYAANAQVVQAGDQLMSIVNDLRR
jgi:flagellar basal-body rod protein FlgG